MASYHTVQTPAAMPGAIAMVRLVHPDPSVLGLPNPKLGGVVLGSIFEIDEGVIARFDDESIVLMPHGGIAIVRLISSALIERAVPAQNLNPEKMYPEASSEIEAWMLWVLSQASSPLAVDLLLDQPKRWASIGIDKLADAPAEDVADEGVLNWLLTPPTVAAVGRANIGKSTLINALAGDHVALVADVAGTTRDHVGVLVDLGGLVVRWVDTPGVDERVADGPEVELASKVVASAACVVHCIDSFNDPGRLDPRLEYAIADGCAMIRVGTRADLAELGSQPIELVDCSVAAGLTAGQGLHGLVECIKEALVPAQALADPRPWRFWDNSTGF